MTFKHPAPLPSLFPYPYPCFEKHFYPFRLRTSIFKKSPSTFRSRIGSFKLITYPLRSRTIKTKIDPYPLRPRSRTWVRIQEVIRIPYPHSGVWFIHSTCQTVVGLGSGTVHLSFFFLSEFPLLLLWDHVTNDYHIFFLMEIPCKIFPLQFYKGIPL